MNTLKVLIIVLLLFKYENSFCQTAHIFSKFTGKWVNTQYEVYQKTTTNKNILYSITPQYILIDSIGICTFFIRYEQKSIVGKPIRERMYGNIKELTYKKIYEFSLAEIKDAEDLIVLSGKSFPGSIIFKRQ